MQAESRSRAPLWTAGAFRRNRCVVHELNTSADEFRAFARDELPPLHIVVDDGCHTPTSQWECFRQLFPRLEPGGVYIIEDIEDPATFFGISERCCFGAIVGATSGHNDDKYFSSSAVQQARERCAAHAAETVATAAARARKACDGAREARAQLPADASSETVVKLDAAMAQKQAKADELARDTEGDQARARRAATQAFDEVLTWAREAAALVQAVEVRQMNVAFIKR